MRFPALKFAQILGFYFLFFFVMDPWAMTQLFVPYFIESICPMCRVSISSFSFLMSALRPCHQLDIFFYSLPAFDQPLMTRLNLLKNVLLSWSREERIAQGHHMLIDLLLLSLIFLRSQCYVAVLSVACCMFGAGVTCVFLIYFSNWYF